MNTQIKEPNQNLISFPPTLYIQGDKEYRVLRAKLATVRLRKHLAVKNELDGVK